VSESSPARHTTGGATASYASFSNINTELLMFFSFKIHPLKRNIFHKIAEENQRVDSSIPEIIWELDCIICQRYAKKRLGIIYSPLFFTFALPTAAERIACCSVKQRSKNYFFPKMFSEGGKES
jgi:hypothetical protein